MYYSSWLQFRRLVGWCWSAVPFVVIFLSSTVCTVLTSDPPGIWTVCTVLIVCLSSNLFCVLWYSIFSNAESFVCLQLLLCLTLSAELMLSVWSLESLESLSWPLTVLFLLQTGCTLLCSTCTSFSLILLTTGASTLLFSVSFLPSFCFDSSCSAHELMKKVLSTHRMHKKTQEGGQGVWRILTSRLFCAIPVQHKVNWTDCPAMLLYSSIR